MTSLAQPSTHPGSATPTIADEAAAIQGMIISGYGKLSQSAYLFLHIKDPQKGRTWLSHLVEHVTSGAQRNPTPAINIGLTHSGLQQLGLPAAALQSFPQDFVQGMAHPERARQLGDCDDNAPSHWQFGAADPDPERRIDLLLILQTQTEQELHELCQQHLELIQSLQGLSVVQIEHGYMPEDSKEHFGFLDSVSQPEIEGSPKLAQHRQIPPERDILKAGEFVLGYLNEDQNFPATPTISADLDPQGLLPTLPNGLHPGLRDLGRNGSFLVVRKLSQDVAGFRRYFQEQFSSPDERELMAAKVMGRWPSGAPLSLSPDQDDPCLGPENDFLFMTGDAKGLRCPVGAHIRRMNPRDSLGQDPQASLKGVRRRRIIRRGVLYGPPLAADQIEDDGQERGLLFICINVDIRRQFEFIQQTWVNNPAFNGLYDELDPVIGHPSGQMTIPQEPVRKKLHLPSFVQMRGGGYFFLPSLPALRFLAQLQPDSSS
jgi:Dyp-type peroxidase family